MHVDIGPVSGASARAWISYAADMLTLLRTVPDATLSSKELDAFAGLLDEWRPIAERDNGVFRWSSSESPERVQYLINALYVAGTVIEREAAAGRAHLRPAAADEFHIRLVRGVLDALEHESEADAHFARQMRDLWTIARPD
jgi:hypothetical protein